MKRHRSSAFSTGILAVVMAVAGLVSTTPAQAQTYKYGPSGTNPSHRVWIQITGTQVEIRGQFSTGDIPEDNGGVYSGTMNTSIPTVAGVTNNVNFGVKNPTINGTGDNQHIVGWVSSTQFHINQGNSFWRLNLESGPPAGKPPTVSITAPTGGATYTAPATVNITANASDTDGTIAKVEFYQGATKLGEDTSSSEGWSYTWNGATVGAYALKAKAYDNVGASTESAVVDISVTLPPGPNQAPAILAPASTASKPSVGMGCAVQVTATDDGKPSPPSTLTYTWSKVSGPGGVTFSPNGTAGSSSSILADYSGTYTFYVTGDDGVRLWVNSQQLVDQWKDQGATEYSGTIDISAGQKYDVKLEYYESGGGAEARLKWSHASVPKAVIPQDHLVLGP